MPGSTAAILGVLGCLLIAAIVLAPGAVELNGTRVPIGARWTVADCARFAGLRLEAGDLLDVHGAVLRHGGGVAAAAWRNGAGVPLGERVRPGDHIRFVEARDTTEPVTSHIRYLDAPCRLRDGRVVPGSSSRRFVRGIRRDRRGAISGKLASSEDTYAAAVVLTAAAAKPSKCVALTFDDGPNDVWTPQYQAVLSQYGARATFFVLGQAVKAYGGVIRRHLELGNEVGTHSWRHSDFRRLSATQARDDLTRCLHAMKDVGVQQVRWFRPPWGEHTKTTDAVAASLGLRIAMWDVDTNDWQRPGASKIAARVLAGLKDKRVILMHDGPAHREQTLAALRIVIPQIQKRGYQLVTMSEAKGLTPGFTGEVIYTVGGRELRLSPVPGGKVVVNGKPLALSVPLLRCGEEYLLPARQVASALGASIRYDKKCEALNIDGAAGSVYLELDSPRCVLNGEALVLPFPPVLYGGQGLAPAAVIARACGATTAYDASSKTLRLDTVAAVWESVTGTSGG